MVNINILIPLGMLINEIVTNAFKHAFGDVSSPEIHIHLSVNKTNDLFIKIADNGRGIDSDDELLSGNSTGFTIINALREQLCAEILIKSKEGMSYEIRIPAEIYELEKNNKKV